jgi:hypothetical protein
LNGWGQILAAARSERDVFELACAAPRASQGALLRRILEANTNSDFGRAHHFGMIGSLEEFRARVPIRDYDEFVPWLDRIAGGEASVLTTEPVIAFEETGGTRSGRKLVPYTSSSLRAFRAAVLPWLSTLAERRPGAFAGKAYVAISPMARRPRRMAGIPVGLASEGAYLGADLIAAFVDVLAVPPAVAGLTDVDEWRFATLAHLLASADLTIVSIWSPTFLIGLLDAIPGLAEPLARAICDGTTGIAADPVRAKCIDAALARIPIDTERLWPRLDTVSAWASGASRFYARRLAEMLPHSVLQPKGLLATEGAVTTDCCLSWPVPALTSAVLEFIDEAGTSHLCDELRVGECYRVLMTNHSGFYRYDLGDRLCCRGYAGPLPMLEFVGREVTIDLVGEKICEAFISEALSRVDGAACLAPRPMGRPFYELLIESRQASGQPLAASVVDEYLCANPQYAYARRIGQLGPVVMRKVDGLFDRYMRAALLPDRRLSDVKPPTLIDDARIYAAIIN